MKKQLFLTAVLGALFALSACDNKAASSVDDTTSSVPASEAQSVVATQTLSSADGKVSITVEGDFTDKLADAAQLVNDIPSKDIVLLQQDNAQDVLIFSANLGKVKSDPNTFLDGLSNNLKNDKTINNLVISDIANNSLNYSLSNGEGEEAMTEACVSNVVNNNIMLTCAISASNSPDALGKILSGVNIQ